MGQVSTGEIGWQESHRPGQVGDGVGGEERGGFAGKKEKCKGC